MKTFFWGTDVGDFLFKGLVVTNAGTLFATCLCVASVAFLFELLRYLQAKHRQKELRLKSLQLRTICPPESDSAALLAGKRTHANNPIPVTTLDRTLLYGADFGIWFVLYNMGYLLMLSVMVYSNWIFLSAILGGGLGYFVFGQRFMKLNLQNCQIIRDTFCMQNCGEPSPGTSESSTSLLRPPAEGDGHGDQSIDREVSVTVHATECH